MVATNPGRKFRSNSRDLLHRARLCPELLPAWVPERDRADAVQHIAAAEADPGGVDGNGAAFFRRFAELASDGGAGSGRRTIELLDLVPAYWRHLSKFDTVRREVRLLFTQRAYFVPASLGRSVGKVLSTEDREMIEDRDARKKTTLIGRQTRLPRSPRLRASDLPKWVVIESGTREQLLSIFNDARWHVAAVGQKHFSSVFEPLERFAREECTRSGPMAALQLLDLVPAYVESCDRFSWLLDTLERVFFRREYLLFKRLSKKIGKLPSDEDQVRSFFVQNLLSAVVGGGIVASGVTYPDAISRAATAFGVTRGAIKKSLERERKKSR